jgi:IS5 family transposase
LKTFKRQRDYGFFDQDIRLSKLSALGDPLEKLNAGIDFDIFRNLLEAGLTKPIKGKGGRPPYDYVLMFKILILQRYYNLSDDQTEYQINDRMSFMRFLDLTIADDIPDSKTVWLFREQLVNLELIEPLFRLFIKELERLNLIVNEGKIVDASFIEVPRQRNSRDENEQIKDGETPDAFKGNPNRLRQKDVDARWTKKNNQTFYGYKVHVNSDRKHKIIVKYIVTAASVHDSQPIDALLAPGPVEGEELHADSAYSGEGQAATIASRGMKGQVCEKGYKNHPLDEMQRTNNRIKSRVRARVEHIFGFMEGSMGGMFQQAIGQKRIAGIAGLMCLTYNLFRKICLQPGKGVVCPVVA